MDTNSLDFCKNTSIFYDSDNKNSKEKYSQQIGNYRMVPKVTTSPNDATCLMLNHSTIHNNYGNGWIGDQGSLIDIDSSLRNAKNLTNTGEIHQLISENYFPVPYLARGPGNPCVESVLRVGENVSQSKSCNSFSREDMTEYRFTPLVNNIADQQDYRHIIPESIDKNWVRGGRSSREMLKQPNTLEKMGFIHNGKFWEKQKQK